MEYDYDSARKRVSPIFAQLIESVLSACALKNRALIPEARAQIRKRDDTGLMNSFVTHNLRRLLADTKGVSFLDRHGQLQVFIGADYRIKTKQRGRWRLVDMHDTQLAMDFCHQLPEMFPGMPYPTTNLFLTYRLDKTRTSIEAISLLCPETDRTAVWEMDLITEHLQQPLPLALDEPASEPPVVKPVMPKEKKRGRRTTKPSNPRKI